MFKNSVEVKVNRDMDNTVGYKMLDYYEIGMKKKRRLLTVILLLCSIITC